VVLAAVGRTWVSMAIRFFPLAATKFPTGGHLFSLIDELVGTEYIAPPTLISDCQFTFLVSPKHSVRGRCSSSPSSF
jgi:hypothetical protein